MEVSLVLAGMKLHAVEFGKLPIRAKPEKLIVLKQSPPRRYEYPAPLALFSVLRRIADHHLQLVRRKSRQISERIGATQCSSSQLQGANRRHCTAIVRFAPNARKLLVFKVRGRGVVSQDHNGSRMIIV